MALTINAIETSYDGYKFRSRLEARWAVFFNALGLTWDYEKEGVVLPSGRWYLPDFYLHALGWFEIKPKPQDFDGLPWAEHGSVEYEFLTEPIAKAEITGIFEECEPRHVLFGMPGVAKIYDASSSYAGCTTGDSSYFFCECPACNVIGFQFDGRSERNTHTPICLITSSGPKYYNMNSPRILAACHAARSARFEHGERGMLWRNVPK